MNPIYLLIDEIDGFIERSSTEEKEGSKYLNISLTDSNSEVLKKCTKTLSGIKDQMKRINNVKLSECNSVEYGKDYMKIKFNSDDNFPLDKILKFRILAIIIRNIFEEDSKYYYPHIFLDDCLYEV